jgi:hypothetical protein
MSGPIHSRIRLQRRERDYFVSLQTSIVITEEYNFMDNSEKLIGTTEYLTLYMRCLINQYRYNRVRLSHSSI